MGGGEPGRRHQTPQDLPARRDQVGETHEGVDLVGRRRVERVVGEGQAARLAELERRQDVGDPGGDAGGFRFGMQADGLRHVAVPVPRADGRVEFCTNVRGDRRSDAV